MSPAPPPVMPSGALLFGLVLLALSVVVRALAQGTL